MNLYKIYYVSLYQTMIDKSLYNIDKEVFLALNSTHTPVADSIMFSYRNFFLWVLITFLSIFLYRNFRRSKKRSTSLIKLILVFGLTGCQIILCMVVLPYLFSFLDQVQRPAYNSEFSHISAFDQFEFTRKEVFFAARACAVAALSFFFIAYYETPKWLKVFLFLWILLVAFNRIYIGAFYPSSVLMSIFLGAGIGLYSYRYYYYLKNSVLVI